MTRWTVYLQVTSAVHSVGLSVPPVIRVTCAIFPTVPGTVGPAGTVLGPEELW